MKKCFILASLIVLSIGISSCGSSGSQEMTENDLIVDSDIIAKNEEKPKEVIKKTETGSEIIEEKSNTGSLSLDTNENKENLSGSSLEPEDTTKFSDVLKDFYNNINQKAFDKASNYKDTTFQTDKNLKEYFSDDRIKKFIEKVGSLDISNIKEVPEERKENEAIIRRVFSYNISYKVGAESFTEDWKMYVLKYKANSEYKINSIYCDKSGAFFDFEKYGI